MPTSLDSAYNGLPFCELGSQDDATLDLAFRGAPFALFGLASPSDVAATSSQAQTSSAAIVAMDVLDVSVSLSQAQTSAASTVVLTPGDMQGTASQVQSAAAEAAVDSPMQAETAQAQTAAAEAFRSISVSSQTSQAQTGESAVELADPWGTAFEGSVRYINTSVPLSSNAFDLVSGNHVLVGFHYTSKNGGGDITITSVTDLAGNTYTAGPSATLEISSSNHQSVAWYYLLNAPSDYVDNEVTVAFSTTHGQLTIAVLQVESLGPAEFGSQVVDELDSGYRYFINTEFAAPATNGIMVAAQMSYFYDTDPVTDGVDGFPSMTHMERMPSDTNYRTLYAYSRGEGVANFLAPEVTSNLRAVVAMTIVATESNDAVTGTKQAQKVQATIGSAVDVSVATSQAQSIIAADVIVELVAGTSQAQTAASETGVEASMSVDGSQAQTVAAEAVAGVSVASGTSNAQTVSAEAALTSDLASGSSQAQTSGAEVGLESGSDAASSQAQTVSADAGTAIDAVIYTRQFQRVAGMIRGENINTIETGQVQTSAAEGGTESAVQTGTKQGQRIGSAIFVAIDMTVETAQAQHIGNSTYLTPGSDVVAATAQAQRIVGADLAIIVPKVGTLVAGRRFVRVAVSGDVATRASLEGDTSIKCSVSGRINVRPL